MLSLVVERQGLCNTFALIIAAALADGVDVAPIGLCLRVLQWITIHLHEREKALSNCFSVFVLLNRHRERQHKTSVFVRQEGGIWSFLGISKALGSQKALSLGVLLTYQNR